MESGDEPLTSKSEHIIQNFAGCGLFQVLAFFLVFIVGHLGNAFVQMFMSFGIYNPGWRCLDSKNGTNSTHYATDAMSPFTSSAHVGGVRITTPTTPWGSASTNTSGYITDDDHCALFDSCRHIEFLPGTSTIVTEWGLLCGKSWIPQLMISLQYAGMVLGATCAGHVGDAIGRKTTMYVAPALACVISVLSYFSTSWQLFTVLRFLVGLSMSSFVIFHYVYVAEFVTNKWRSLLPNVPYWPFVCMLFSVAAMVMKDWKQVTIATAIITGVSVLPALWLPESPRWLEVKNKSEKFKSAMKKILKTNRKSTDCLEGVDFSPDCVKNINDDTDYGEDNEQQNLIRSSSDNKNYSIKDLFTPQYIKFTLLLAIPWFSASLIFYAIGFGTKALSGDFYVNLIVMNVIEIPFAPLTMSLPNLIGRRMSGILFSGFAGACLLTAACFHKFTSGVAQTTCVLILAIVARISTNGFWGVIMVYTVELYPTVVRGLGTSWGNFMNRLGGVVAPFLIPNDSGSFFICYVVMAAIAFLCVIIVAQLPETKGKKLKERLNSC